MYVSTLLIVSKFSGRRSLSETLIPHSFSMTETKSTRENESKTPARKRELFASGKLVRLSLAAFDKNDITDSGNMIFSFNTSLLFSIDCSLCNIAGRQLFFVLFKRVDNCG